MKGVLACGLLLAACAAPPAPGPVLRDPSALLASKADLDPASLAGRWHEVASLGPGACPGGAVDYAPLPGGALAVRETCRARAVSGSATLTGPGRLAVTRGGATVVEWVLWMDADARTAVTARADGRGARVLDRTPASSPDRLRAAESVLDFNGFDPAALRRS